MKICPSHFRTSPFVLGFAVKQAGFFLLAMFCLMFALAPIASGQVTMTVNVPPYGWLVEPGAARTVAAYPAGAGAKTKLVNWTSSSGISLSCSKNCQPLVTATITATTGTASVTGNVGAYVLSSTNEQYLYGQSVDDPTVTVTIPFHIQETCSQATVDVEPAYNQAYKGQQKMLQSYVPGCINEGVTWAITSQPTGGNGTLIDTVNRDTRFSATVTGRYTITATSKANGAISGSAIIYVSPNNMPSYSVTPNKTEPTECYVDPALTGPHYEIGPTQTTTDPTTIDLSATVHGTMLRFHNEDTTGLSPTKFANGFLIAGTGTYNDPIYICGVADSLGNLPIIEGQNMRERSSDNLTYVGNGAFKLHNGYGIAGYNGTSEGPDYVSITGLRIEHFNIGTPMYATGSTLGGGALQAIYTFGSKHFLMEGLDVDDTGWGLLDNNNTTSNGDSWAAFHQFIGGHISNFGSASSTYAFSLHALYMEANYSLVEGTLIEKPVTGSNGVYVKMRGGESIIRYNTMRDIAGTGAIAYPEMQDSYQYTNVSENLGVPAVLNLTSVDTSSGGSTTYHGIIVGGGKANTWGGKTVTIRGFATSANNGTFTVGIDPDNPGTSHSNSNAVSIVITNPNAVAETNNAATLTQPVGCNDSMWCMQTTNNITLPQLANNAETLAKDYVYGNIISNYGSQATTFQYGSFSAPNDGCAPCTAMSDRQGRLYAFNNTIDQPLIVFQTAQTSGVYQATPQYSFATIAAYNNSIWAPVTSARGFSLNLDATHIASYQTNLYAAGSISLTAPIAGGTTLGWGGYVSPYAFPLYNPMQTHLSGLTSANFLTSTAIPYSLITMVPVAGSPLINAGTPITDPALVGMPVRFQPNYSGYMSARSNPLTIGAVETGPAITLASITVNASSSTVGIGGFLYYSATCNYSDGSSSDCSSLVSWSSTNNSALTFWYASRSVGQAYQNGSGYTQASYLGVVGQIPFGVGSATPPVVIPVTPITPVQPVTPLQPATPAPPTASITVAQPEFGFNVLPGSVRRVFATVTNGSTNGVSWAVKSGSATLSSNSGSWVDVTAPATGSSCSLAVASSAWSVNSATQFVVEATSTDDPTQSFDLTFNVCNPKVQLDVVPYYRTLYANQSADIQSMIEGSTDLNVHWAITSMPKGGDGALTDTTLRDTVFSGTVPGRYVLTATSQADPTVSSTAIMYVTGHTMPYKVTPNLTEPVDCTVDPTLLGTVYEVGPSQAFKTLASVPFSQMIPGTTVRLHNEDTSGRSPTTYHEYVQIVPSSTTQAQPIRICGVPDSFGNLPVMDANGATGRSDASSSVAGYGLITVGVESGTSFYPNYSGPAYLSIEGIKFQNAQSGYNFSEPQGGSGSWTGTSAAIRLGQAHNVAIVGNDITNNGNGAYSDFTSALDWGGSVVDVLWEGNHFHGNGSVGSALSHQMNLQGWNEIVQFNRIESYPAGATGANVKSRGLGTVIRYNYLGDGPVRQMDLAEAQDSTTYMTFSGYLDGYPNSFHDLNTNDQYTADLLAAAQEEWNSHFVYGNIYQNTTSTAPIHFGYDTTGGEAARKGSLYWYNNTFNEGQCSSCTNQALTLFDTQGVGGVDVSQVEYPTVQVFNNALWLANPALPAFSWNSDTSFIGVSGTNLMPANWGTNVQTGGTGTGWSVADSATDYQNASSLSAHLTGFSSTNLETVSATLFDLTTWILKKDVVAGAVPSAVCEMPVRFSYLPTLGYAVPRIATPSLGATDTIQEIASEMILVGGAARSNTRNSNCR